MSSVISAAELGLNNSRLQSGVGEAGVGQANTGVYVNASTGNLVLQQQDQLLIGQGIDSALVRTYNSLGRHNDDNGDNFRFAFNQRLAALVGAVNTDGSRVIRTAGDGSESTFEYDASLGLYVSNEGAGAHDTLSYDESADEWLYTEGTSQQQERYDWSNGEGRLIARADVDGNMTTYGYHVNGFVNSIEDASGQLMSITYVGRNATEVHTRHAGVTQTLVRYGYDVLNRLTEVSVDLSPDDRSVADGNEYLTRYTYDGDSRRVDTVSQSDGTSVSFNYDTQGRVVAVIDGEGHKTTYNYSNVEEQRYDLQSSGLATVEAERAYTLDERLLLSSRESEQSETLAVDAAQIRTTEVISQALSLDPASLSDTVTEPQEQDYSLDHNLLSTTIPGSQNLLLNENRLSDTKMVSQLLTRELNPSALDTPIVLSSQLDEEQLRRDEIVTPYTRDHVLDASLLSTTENSTSNHALFPDRLSHTKQATETQAHGLTSGRLSNARTYSYSTTHISYDPGKSSENGTIWSPENYYLVRSGDTWESVASRVYGSSRVGDELKARTSMSYYTYESVTRYTENGPVTETTKVVKNATNLSQPIAGTRLIGFPSTLTDYDVPLGSYYTVGSGDTWSSIANYLYGTQNVGDELRTAMGNVSLSLGRHLSGFPASLTNTYTVTITVPPYYTVPSGATWSSIANVLYGTSDVADELASAMGNPPLTAGSELTGFPATLIDDDVVLTVAAYYAVRTGDTWASIAEYLYGSADVADELQATLGTPTLVVGSRLVGLPSTLTDTYHVTTYSDPYYLVGASDSWSIIARALYGTHNVDDELREAMGNPDLGEGVRLVDFPVLLTDDDLERFYTFKEGDTWKSVAQALYGSSAVSEQLRSSLLHLGADENGVLDGPYTEDGAFQPGEIPVGISVQESQLLSELTEISWQPETVPPFYIVRADDTWNSISEFLYGDSEGSDELRVAMGDPSLSPGLELSGFPTSLTDDDVIIATPAYYAVQVGDTWASIAQNLYGSSKVANELQLALGNPNLSSGSSLVNFPESLTDTFFVTRNVAPYYEVQPSDTWLSISHALYGTSAGADELREIFGDVSLVSGNKLTNIPTSLVDDDLVVDTPAYYIIQAGDTWESIAIALYGQGDVSDQLRLTLGNPDLIEGARLAGLPAQLTHVYTLAEVAPTHYRVPANATWESIAALLYGTSDLADTLAEALGNPTLVEGLELTGLPGSLIESADVSSEVNPDVSSDTVSIASYYTVRSGDTWSYLADILYGDSSLALSLQSSMDYVDLRAGTELGPLPELLASVVTKTYVSDLPLNVVANGWGPAERDTNVGSYNANDGSALSLDGQVYEKGLGVHADSDIRIDLTSNNYTRFQSYIGMDDSRNGSHHIQFFVYGDGELLYDSGLMTGLDSAQFVDVSVEGMSELRLVVDRGTDGAAHDHANWADAALLSTVQSVEPEEGVPLISTHTTSRDSNARFEQQYEYTVRAGDTWISIATELYGQGGLADALAQVLNAPTLSAGATLGPLPETLMAAASKAYLSDLPLNVVANGWGPVERDTNVGNYNANDGGALSLGGQIYEKGLGVHSDSDIRIDLTANNYTRFQSYIGMDDSRRGSHQVHFFVYGDGELLYDSGAMTGLDAPRFVDVSVENINELRLVVDRGVDGAAHDHANWADAALLVASDVSENLVGVPLNTASVESRRVAVLSGQWYAYTVQPGDTWSSIASALYGSEGLATELARALGSPLLEAGVKLVGLPSSLMGGASSAYVSDLPLQVVENGRGDIALDRANSLNGTADDGTISIGREFYARGLGVFAPSDVRVDLTSANYTRFTSAVGLQRYMTGPVQFEVLADGELLYQSAVLGREEVDHIDIDVSGYDELQLRVVTAGGSWAYQASWGDPQLFMHSDQSPIAAQTTITDALGYSQTLTFDGEGRVVRSLGASDMHGDRDTSLYTYDTEGNVVRVIQQDKVSYTEKNYRYDDRGNMTHEQDREGGVITRTYSASNQVLSETRYLTPDPDSFTQSGEASDAQTQHYIYDGEDHLRFTVSASGRVQEYRYDSEGNPVSHIVYTGGAYVSSGLSESDLGAWVQGQDLTQIQRTDTAYDFRGQVARVIQYAATDSAGTGIVDGSESETQFIYDQQGRLLSTVSPLGTATGDALSRTTSYAYDGLGRLLSATDARGHVSTTIYQDAQQQIHTVSANGRVSTSLLDDNGRVISVTDSANGAALGTVSYKYDGRGHLFATTDTLGNTSYNLIDGDGLLIGTVDAERHLVEYVYDHQGNIGQTIYNAQPLTEFRLASLLSVANSADSSTQRLLDREVAYAASRTDRRHSYHIYDDANRLVYSIDPLKIATHYRYDGAGQLTDTIVYDTPLTQHISSWSRPHNINPVLSEHDRHTRMFYNAQGQVAGTVDALGFLQVNHYDNAGQLVGTSAYATPVDESLRASADLPALLSAVAASDDDQHTHRFYNGKGQVVVSIDAENYFTDYHYDANGNLIEQIRYATPSINYTGVELLAQLRPSPANNDQVTLTTYSALNQVLSVTQQFAGAAVATTAYEYDAVGQLVSTTTAADTAEARTTRARYDVQGRLVGELSGEGSAALAGLTTVTPEAIDALWLAYGMTHTYDVKGRRTSTTDQNNHTTVFYYDSLDRLTHRINDAGEVSTLEYNAFGEVINTTNYSATISTEGLVGGAVTETLENRLAAASNSASDTVVRTNYTLRGAINEVINGDSRTQYAYNAFGQQASQIVKVDADTSIMTTFDYDNRGQQVRVTEDVDGINRTRDIDYDAFGRVVASTDARGVKTSVEYDRLGRAVQTVQASASGEAILNTQTYDAFDRTLTRTDGNGHTTTYTYSDQDREVTMTTPEGMSVTTTRNAHGETVRLRDGNGEVIEYDYDNNGNLTQTTQGVGSAATITTGTQYDQANRVLETTDANGVVTRFEYDAANRVTTRTVDPDGLAISNQYRYDGQGRVTHSVDGNGITTETHYDNQGQVIATVVDVSLAPEGLARPGKFGNPVRQRTEYTYDDRGQALTVIEAAGTLEARTTSYSYDELGRRISMTQDPQGLNIRTEYHYDDNDNLIQTIDPEGTATVYHYDAHNRLTRTVVDPEGLALTQSQSYDDNGNVVTRTDANGVITAFSYDDDNRLTRTTIDPSGLSITASQQYDGNNNVVETLDANGTVTRYTYDSLNRLTHTIVDPDGLAITTSQSYDGNGNVITQTDGNGVVTQYAYDSYNRQVQAIIDPSGLAITTRQAYDANSNVISQTDANGVLTEYRYDGANRRRSTTVDPDGLRITTLQEYDRNGNIKRHVNENGVYTEYTYDAANRLVSSTFDEARFFLTVYPPLPERQLGDYLNIRTDYTYDNNGNLLTQTEAANTSDARTTSYVYDASNRQTAIVDNSGQVTRSTYDANGNIINRTQYATRLTASQRAAIAGDAQSVISQVGTSSDDRITRSVYDANNRITASIDALGQLTEYRYDGNNNLTQVIARHDALSSVALQSIDASAALSGVTPSSHDQTMVHYYDAANRKIYTDNNATQFTQYNYDGNSNLTSTVRYDRPYSELSSAATGLNHQVTYYVYDAANRERFTVNSLGYVSETAYDAAGNTLRAIQYGHAITIPDTHNNAFQFGSVLEGLTEARVRTAVSFHATSASNRTITYQHDALGRTTTEIDADDNIKRLSYDARGNLTRVEDGNGGVGLFFYGSDDKLAYKIDPERYATHFEYNAFGELTQETRFSSPVPTYYNDGSEGFDESGLPEGRILPLSELASQQVLERLVGQAWFGLNGDQRTTTEYDAMGQVTQVTQHSVLGDVVEQYRYDAFGNRTSYINGNGNTFNYVYDSLNRMVEEISPPVDIVTNVTGNSETIVTQRVVTQYDFDTFGNTIAKREAVGLPQERETRTYYDALNRVERIASPQLSVYDPVTSSSSVVTPTLEKTYDAFGNMIREVDAAGNASVLYYDNGNRLIAFVDAEGALSEYEYDAVGNLTRERTYDTRITGATPDTLPVAVSDDGFRELYYTFDGNNRTIEISTPPQTHYSPILAATGPNGNFTAPVSNRMEYDANGNLVRTTDPRGHHIYHYFDEVGNEIVTVDQLGYVTQRDYDHQGQIVREVQYATALPDASFNTLSVDSNPLLLVSTAVQAGTTEQTLDENRITEYDYDALGNLLTERKVNIAYHSVSETNGALQSHTNDVETHYVYDRNGNVVSVAKAVEGMTRLTYDALDRQTEVRVLEQELNAQGLSVYGEESTIGQGENVVYADQSLATLRYDAHGNVAYQRQYADSASDDRIVRAEYNSAGFKVADIDANGHRIDYDLDVFGATLRSREIVVNVNGQAESHQTHYRYDALGRETSMYRAGANADGVTHDTRYNAHGDIDAKGRNGQFQEEYRYDDLGRVFWTNEGNGTPRIYQYDANGNAVVEMVAINDDLKDIHSPEAAVGLDPSSVQFTTSFYDARNQISDVFDAPITYQDLTTHLTPEQEEIIQNIEPDPVVGEVQNLGGFVTNTTTLSVTESTDYQFLPPNPRVDDVILAAADHTDINLNDSTYTESDGTVVTRTVEIMGNGSIRELFTNQRTDGSKDYLTRITEIKKQDVIDAYPIGDSAINPGNVQFHGGDSITYFNHRTVNSNPDRHDETGIVLNPYHYDKRISVPYIEGYGDGPTRIEGLFRGEVKVEKEFFSDLQNYSINNLDTLKLYKGNTLLKTYSLLNLEPNTAYNFDTPKVISIGGESPDVVKVSVRVNGGSTWYTTTRRSYTGSGVEFIRQNIPGTYGDTYEYKAFDAQGNLVNHARGVLGSDSSHETISLVNTSSAIKQTVYEVAADVIPGEVGVSETLLQSSSRQLTATGTPPPVGQTTTYSSTGLTPSVTTEPTETTVFPPTVVTHSDGSTTTTQRTSAVTRATTIEAAPSLTDPHRMKETNTITTVVTTVVTGEVENQQTYTDDEVFAVTETTVDGTTVTTTTATQVEKTEKYHQVVGTTTVSNLSHSPAIAASYPGSVSSSGAKSFYIEITSQLQYSSEFGSSPKPTPLISVTYPSKNVAGYPGDWRYTLSNSNYLKLYKGNHLVSQGTLKFLSRTNHTSGSDENGTLKRYSTSKYSLSTPTTFGVGNAYPQATRAQVSFNNGSSWTTLTHRTLDQSTGQIVFGIKGMNVGSSYQVRTFDSAGNIVQWFKGTTNSGAPTQIYGYTSDYEQVARVTSNSDFTHFQQVTEETSQRRVNYIRKLLYVIGSGEEQKNVIHRQQDRNAFGEIIKEVDGRGYETDIVYDKLGNTISKISPETDVWTEQAVRNGMALRERPTENFFYDAQGNLIGTENANSALATGADKFYNTRLLNNGRLEKEFFADGGQKSYEYDRLGNTTATINQIGLRTDYAYDRKGQLTDIERYSGNGQQHSYDRYAYDARGQRISHENALGDTETYRYDAQGRIIRHTSFEGRQTQYAYQYIASMSNHVTGDTRAIGGTQTTTTNARGDTSVDQHTVFDRIVYHKDLGGHEYNYYYNQAGWLGKQTGTTGDVALGRNDQEIHYTYHNNGYLKEVNDMGNSSHSFFQYDKNGNRVSEYYAETPFNSGSQEKIPYQVATAEYDELNRVKRAYEQDRYDISYTYDAEGNRRHVSSEYFDLLRNQHSQQDFYYRYDNMNRFTVTMGSKDAQGNIVHGNTGYSIGYNALGQRVSATSALLNSSGTAVYSREHYQFDANGAMTNFYLDTSNDGVNNQQLRSRRVNDATGKLTNYLEYNTGGSTVHHKAYHYDRDGVKLSEIDKSNSANRHVTSYTNYADGTLLQSYSRTLLKPSEAKAYEPTYQPNPDPLSEDGPIFTGYSNVARIALYREDGSLAYSAGQTVSESDKGSLYYVDTKDNSLIWNDYTYEAWDSYKQSTITIRGDADNIASWEPGTSTFTYNSNGHVRHVYDHEDKRSYDYVSNHQGQILKRYQIDENDELLEDPIVRRFYYLNGIGIGDVGTDEIDSRVDYAQILAERKLRESKGSEGGPAHGDIKDRVSVVTSADFDQNYQPIGPNYPDQTPGSYTVARGDSLQSIANRIWGDASLWYLIADANGLSGDSELTAGTRLTLPNTVTNIHNNSETFKPYDASLTLGDTSPTLPDPVYNSPDKGCGGFLQIIVIAITVVVAVYTAGAATAALAPATSTAAATTGFGATFSLGLTTTNAAALAIGAAAGSVAGQLFGMAVGLQDGFDWGAVAIAGLTAGLTAGLSQHIGGTGWFGDLGNFGKGFVRGIAANTVGQGVNIAFGRQDKFDWAGVAASGLGGGLNASLNSTSVNLTGATTSGGKFGQDVFNGLRRGIVNNAVEYIVRGEDDYKERGGFDAQGLLISVVGNALGNAVNRGIHERYQADQIVSQYDQMIAERRGSVGDAEGVDYIRRRTIGEQFIQASADNRNGVGEAEAAENYARQQETLTPTVAIDEMEAPERSSPDLQIPSDKVGSFLNTKQAQDSNSQNTSGSDLDEYVNTGSGVGNKNNKASTVVGKNGRRVYNNLDASDPARGFTKDPLSKKALSESKQNNKFNSSLDIKLKGELFDPIDYDHNFIDSNNDFLVFSSKTQGAGEVSVDKNGVKVDGVLGADATLTYAQGQTDVGVATVAADLKSTAAIGANGGLEASRHGFEVRAGAKAEAVAAQFSGSIESKKLDLYLFDVSVRADGDANVLGIGASGEAGFIANKGKIRATVGAGLTAVFGARVRLGIDINVNFDNISKTYNNVASFFDFKSQGSTK